MPQRLSPEDWDFLEEVWKEDSKQIDEGGQPEIAVRLHKHGLIHTKATSGEGPAFEYYLSKEGFEKIDSYKRRG
jgi:hypothetical protein